MLPRLIDHVGVKVGFGWCQVLCVAGYCRVVALNFDRWRSGPVLKRNHDVWPFGLVVVCRRFWLRLGSLLG